MNRTVYRPTLSFSTRALTTNPLHVNNNVLTSPYNPLKSILAVLPFPSTTHRSQLLAIEISAGINNRIMYYLGRLSPGENNRLTDSQRNRNTISLSLDEFRTGSLDIDLFLNNTEDDHGKRVVYKNKRILEGYASYSINQ